MNICARGGASVQILTERAGWAPQAQFVNQTLVSDRLIFARRRQCRALSGDLLSRTDTKVSFDTFV